MTLFSNAITETVALRVAQAEAELADATNLRDTRQCEAATLRARHGAVLAQINGLRSTASARELTDKEAAALNLAVMDAADLERMISETAPDDSAAVDALQASLRSARRELCQVTAALRRDSLLAEARSLEMQLCDRLNEAWGAAKDAEPQVRFVSIWQPGEGLRRAAVHHQPPAVGCFS